MSDFHLTPWPDRLCSDEDARGAITQPLRFGSWRACTDGRIAVGVRGDEKQATEAPQVVERTLRGYFEAKRNDWSAPLDIGELLDWCGPAEDHMDGPCAACDETRRVPCTCNCGHQHEAPCYGCRLDRYEGDRIGDIGRVRFSRRLLAAILDGAPGETVQLSPGDGGRDPVLLHGSGWRGVLMPMRNGEDTDAIEDRKVLDLSEVTTR